MSNRMFLDIDDSIIKNNLTLPDMKTDDEFTEMLSKLDKPSPKFTICRPKPGACVKTKTEDGEKVFLNICHTPEIPAPEDISEDDLMQLISDNSPEYRVPMSIANERFENNNAGEPCLTYDVAINSKYFEKCQKSQVFWIFTITVSIDGVSHKFDKNLNSQNYVVLKNKKVLGKIADQRIEKREPKKAVVPKKLIEEISSGESSTKKAIEPQMEIKTTSTQDYLILRYPAEGKIEKLIGLFKMPKVNSAEQITVDIGGDRIVVEVKKPNRMFDVFVPYHIDRDKVDALFDLSINVLQINMPVCTN